MRATLATIVRMSLNRSNQNCFGVSITWYRCIDLNASVCHSLLFSNDGSNIASALRLLLFLNDCQKVALAFQSYDMDVQWMSSLALLERWIERRFDVSNSMIWICTADSISSWLIKCYLDANFGLTLLNACLLIHRTKFPGHVHQRFALHILSFVLPQNT